MNKSILITALAFVLSGSAYADTQAYGFVTPSEMTITFTELRLIKADPASYQLLGRAKIEAMWCPTPAPHDGRLIVRRKDKLVCFDLR
jgi:hypothetical protein